MEDNQQQTSPRPGVKSFLTYRLSRLHYNLDAHAQAILKKHTDLSLIEWRILSLIHHEVRATISDLIAASRIHENELSDNLQKLLQKSYVLSSQPTTEERAEFFFLSMEGLNLYNDHLPHMIVRQTLLAAQLSPKEIDALDNILDKLDSAAVDMKNSVA